MATSFKTVRLGSDNIDYGAADAAALAAKITGPASATDNAAARFDATTGKLAQNSLVTIDDSGNVGVPALATVDGRDISVDGATLDGHTTSIATKASKRLAVNEQTGATYSIVQGDEDTGLAGNRATAQTFTADQLVAGTTIPVFQKGAGQITVAAGSGVTLRASDGAKVSGQYRSILLFWYSATEVWISGQATT